MSLFKVFNDQYRDKYEQSLKDIQALYDNLDPCPYKDFFRDTCEFILKMGELEGSLNTVIYQSQLKNKSLSLSEVKSLIKNNIKPKKNVAVKDIVKVVAEQYGIPEDSVYEKTRRKEIVKARQVAMYILREDFNISYPLIGQKMGNRDHTTVIHSHLKIKEDLKTDPSLLQEIEKIRVMLK